VVRGSFDPNDKQVYPTGWGAGGNVLSQSHLKYLIRFENTGTAEAHYIQIRDTLSPHLDVATVKNIGSSHPYNLFFTVEGTLQQPVLVFTFPNIVLPDSNTNKALSQGFVTYSVSAKPGLPQQTMIRNKAFITFDINDPIETNETLNTINDSLPQGNPLVLAVAAKADKMALKVIPNPSNGNFQLQFPGVVSGEFEVFDLQGKRIMNQAVLSAQALDVEIPNKRKGMFLARFTTASKGIFQEKIVVE
jgi:hypothetical protein